MGDESNGGSLQLRHFEVYTDLLREVTVKDPPSPPSRRAETAARNGCWQWLRRRHSHSCVSTTVSEWAQRVGLTRVFPASKRYQDRQSGELKQHHLHETVLQRAVKEAVREAGITKPASCHTFRHSFALSYLRTATAFGRLRNFSGTRMRRGKPDQSAVTAADHPCPWRSGGWIPRGSTSEYTARLGRLSRQVAP